MNEKTVLNRQEGGENKTASIERCISILKAASNDTERFAALLLVTELIRSPDSLDDLGRRQLFDAVGFTFINRLLNTTAVPSQCPQDLYRSLAITLLACFATDKELLFHPQMAAKIPQILDFIESEEQDAVFLDDCYQILVLLASSCKGCSLLDQKGAIVVLCRVISRNISHFDAAMVVLLRMQHFCSHKMWEDIKENFFEILVVLCSRFKQAKSISKFELCKTLVSLVGGAKKVVGGRTEQEQWLKDIYCGLRDILQSKVTSEQRDPAIILVSEVINLVGMQWMVDLAEGGAQGLFVLCITVASIEIRMILDGKITDKVTSKASLLSSCYNILEKAIGFVLEKVSSSSSLQDDGTLLNEIKSSLMRVQRVVTEAIHSILQYLQCVAGTQDILTMAAGERQVVFATVRVLCAWMAEETAALQDDIHQLLPFFMKLAENQLDESTGNFLSGGEYAASDDDPKLDSCGVSDMTVGEMISTNVQADFDLIRFLLPPLCHFTADDKARKTLIDHRGHVLLSRYFFLQWKKWSEAGETDSDAKTSLLTLLSIFLNFCVTEPELVKRDQVFQDIGQHSILIVPKLIARRKHVVVLANLVVLGLMFLRHHLEQKDLQWTSSISSFLTAAICFLKEAKITLSCNEQLQNKWLFQVCKEVWPDISDLWFLGTQVVTALVSSFPFVADLLQESGWIDEIVRNVRDSAQQQDLTTDEKDALLNLARQGCDTL